MRQILRTSIVLPAFVLWIGQASPARAAEESGHHHIHHALHELKEAKKELLESPHDFGGHREAAVKAIDAAILSLDSLLTALGEKPISPKIGAEVYKKYDHHPHLHHAVEELHAAHQQIKESKFDFGKAREAALRDVSYAIEQIELVLKHHDGKKKTSTRSALRIKTKTQA
jgi:hypothetical protein